MEISGCGMGERVSTPIISAKPATVANAICQRGRWQACSQRCHRFGCGAGASRRAVLRMKASRDAGGSPVLC